MRTAGVDLSASERSTALAEVEWGEGRARVGEPSLGLADTELIERLAAAEWSGIDAPFGWPESMVEALRAYLVEGRWPSPPKPDFRYRRADLHVHDRVLAETGEHLWPLSPSTDRISLAAWRLAGLREAAAARSGVRFDRAGGDKVVEVYPAAALLLWGLERRGYKGEGEVPATNRALLVGAIEDRAPWLAWEPGAREACVGSDDALDAVLCALVARAAALGLTDPPSAEDLERARVEGWVHLPRKACLEELAVDGRG